MRLVQKINQGLGQLPYLGRSLHLVWQAAGWWTITWAALLATQGILPLASVSLSRVVVNRLVVVLGRGAILEKAQLLLLPILLIGAVMALTEILRGLSGWVRTVLGELVRDHITDLVQQQSAAIDFAFYESPAYYDRLYRVRTDASFRPLMLLENVGTLLQSSVTLVAMLGVLIPLGFWVPIALLISTLPALYTVLHYNQRQHRWWIRRTPEERRAQYYDWLLTEGETAAEMRLFNLNQHFQALYRTLRYRIRRERLTIARNQALAEFAASAFALMITGITIIWMGWQALGGRLTLGDLALFYQAFNQGQGVMRSVLQSLSQIYSNSLFLSNFFEFLALESQMADAVDPKPVPTALTRGIEFQQVGFHYPGSDRHALENFNLTIPAGKMVAIVGNNGAGKSTLIKLLCRLYDPQQGSITLDGTDLRAFSIPDLRRHITILLQQPVRYNATAAENIILSRIAGEAWGEELPDQLHRLHPEIVQAAEAAGADQPIARLPNQYDTLLGKWFETGTDLSVGEWQRLSLARAFLRPAPLVILDEPTSAMDSWAEADWLKRFRTLVQGRTAIVITHRFTTAMRADLIYVMVNGQVVESGTHDSLVAMEGLYAQSWRVQMEGLE